MSSRENIHQKTINKYTIDNWYFGESNKTFQNPYDSFHLFGIDIETNEWITLIGVEIVNFAEMTVSRLYESYGKHRYDDNWMHSYPLWTVSLKSPNAHYLNWLKPQAPAIAGMFSTDEFDEISKLKKGN